MNDAVAWWDEKRIGQEAVALAVFPCKQTNSPQDDCLVLGAASSETTSVFLWPDELGKFLCQHQEANLICYDAADLHWLLDSKFRRAKGTESLKVLWDYSKDCRLIDIMLLDQHVRRCQGKGGAEATPLERLVQRCAGITLPKNDEVIHQVAAALKRRSPNLNDSVLRSALMIADGILQAYKHLIVAVEDIENAVKASQLPPTMMSKPDPATVKEMAAQSDELFRKILAKRPSSSDPPVVPEGVGDAAHPVRTHPFGPLGIGIDVQAAIALRRPDRPSLRIAPDQLDLVRQKSKQTFERACTALWEDAESRNYAVTAVMRSQAAADARGGDRA